MDEPSPNGDDTLVLPFPENLGCYFHLGPSMKNFSTTAGATDRGGTDCERHNHVEPWTTPQRPQSLSQSMIIVHPSTKPGTRFTDGWAGGLEVLIDGMPDVFFFPLALGFEPVTPGL